MPRPDLQLQVLVPSNKDEVLKGNDFTYVVMTWSDFISLAQWFEALRVFVKQNDAVLDYWENGPANKTDDQPHN